MVSDLRAKMARGAIWMVLFKLLDRSIGLISTLILVRLLVPADFGVVAMATSLVALLELFGAFGFDNALIQRQNAGRAHYDTAWTLNLLISLALAVSMAALAFPIAAYYQESKVVPIVFALAVTCAIQGLENIGVVNFRKDMMFDKEFRYLLTKRLIAFAVTVPLAFWWRNHWALVAGMIAGRCAGVALSYALHPYRPRFSLAAGKDLFSFSKWMVLINVLAFLKERSADFVIGRIAGPHALGMFNISVEFANAPGNELVAPINRAIYPAYAKLAHDLDALRTEYLSVMSLIALIAMPAIAGIAATANLIVPVVFGAKWLEARSLLALLAIFGVGQIMFTNAYAAFLALDRADVPTRISAIYVAVQLALLVTLTPMFGLMGAASAYVATSLLMLPLVFAYVYSILRVRAGAMLRVVWRPLLAASLMFAVVKAFVGRVHHESDPTLQTAAELLAAIALGVAVYVSLVLLLWAACGRPQGAERMALNRVRARLRRAPAAS